MYNIMRNLTVGAERGIYMEKKICSVCGKKMNLFDHDDEDGNLDRWEWQCECGHTEDEEEY